MEWKSLNVVKRVFHTFSEKKYRRNLLKFQKQFHSCGKDLKVFGNPTIIASNNIIIGDGNVLNDRCILNATGSFIEMGNNIIVSNDAKIMAATLEVNDFVFYNNRHHINKGIIIGDNTWVCAGAIICPGVHIKGSCVIAAGAVVTKDVTETNVIIAGNPAHILKYLG